MLGTVQDRAGSSETLGFTLRIIVGQKTDIDSSGVKFYQIQLTGASIFRPTGDDDVSVGQTVYIYHSK